MTAIAAAVKRIAVWQGDCLEVMRKRVRDQSIDLVLCDPPYGTTDLAWDKRLDFEELWSELGRVLKPGGSVLLFASQPFTTDVIESNRKWFRWVWYWRKTRPSGYANAPRRPMKVIEEVCVFSATPPLYQPQGLRELVKPKPSRTTSGAVGGRSFRDDYVQTRTGYPMHILEYASVGRCEHPTQKPVELLRYLIRTHSRPEDLVLDFTMGSGSTGVAAVEEGRRFVGIERDGEYMAIARRRIREAARGVRLGAAGA